MKKYMKEWTSALEKLGWNPSDFAIPYHEIEVPGSLRTICSWSLAPIEKLTEYVEAGSGFLPLVESASQRKTAHALWEVRDDPARVVALMFRVFHHSEDDCLLRSRDRAYLRHLTLAGWVAPEPDWLYRARTLLPIRVGPPFEREPGWFDPGGFRPFHEWLLPHLGATLKKNLAEYPLVRISGDPVGTPLGPLRLPGRTPTSH